MSDRELIDQADALINRYRPAPVPRPVVAPADDEDLPLLTQVVDSTAIVAPDAEAPPAPDPHVAVRAALGRELETWLDTILPQTVKRVLDGLSDQLISQVAAQARLELLPHLKSALENRIRNE